MRLVEAVVILGFRRVCLEVVLKTRYQTLAIESRTVLVVCDVQLFGGCSGMKSVN